MNSEDIDKIGKRKSVNDTGLEMAFPKRLSSRSEQFDK